MRCLIIDGSGHVGGNTDQMCQMLENMLSAKGCETRIERLGEGMEHCTGCGRCRSSACPIEDRLADVIRSLHGYDLLIVATPIRFNGVSSQTKTFIDRLNPMWFEKETMTPKTYAILVGGSPEPNFGNALSVLRSMAKGTGSEWGGSLEISDTDRIPADAHIEELDDFVGTVLGENNRTGT